MAQALSGSDQKRHIFASPDETWSLVLTSDFIALSTTQYTRWEDFGARLDSAIETFEQIYDPAPFSRVGLRYRDVIDRSKLSLDDVPWSALLRPSIAAELADEVFDESDVLELMRTVRMDVGDGLHLLLRHGLVPRAEAATAAPRAYAIDADFYSEEESDAGRAREILTRANLQAGRLFRWCIEPKLEDALLSDAVD